MLPSELAEMTADVSRGKPESGFLGLLRPAALIAVVAGAAGSLVLLLRAGQRTPRFLLFLLAIWVLSPFKALAVAHRISKGWPVPTRATLYSLIVVVALASLAIYGDDAFGHRMPQAGFVYVVVPLVSWLLMVIVTIAALVSGTLSRRRDGS